MAQRGRRSQASLTVVPFKATRERLAAPVSLTKAERALFLSTVATNPHLRSADAPMVAAYAQLMCKAFTLGKKSDTQSIGSLNKVARLAAMWATKLRITSQSQVLPDMAGRKRNAAPLTFAERMMMEDD